MSSPSGERGAAACPSDPKAGLDMRVRFSSSAVISISAASASAFAAAALAASHDACFGEKKGRFVSESQKKT